MISESLDNFVRFGRALDREDRQTLVNYWLSRFGLHPEPELSSQARLRPYVKLMNSLLQNRDLIQLCRTDRAVLEDITARLFERYEAAQREEDINHPYRDEEISLMKWKTIPTESFLSQGNHALEEIGKYYSQNDFNFAFFLPRITEIGGELGKNEISEEEEALKHEILMRWEALLLKKKHRFFLQELDKARREMCEQIYKQIEQFKRMQQILQPFASECGRLWDLSKGLWHNVGFDILEQYAILLQKEPGLKQLAEMLGRMHQAEDELEEEEIRETIIRPRLEITHAGKSEYVGVHESNDINSLLPAELTLLDSHTTELLFYDKFAEKKLLTYDFIGFDLGKREEQRTRRKIVPKKKSRGPIIICVDTSGSMHGTPEYIAKVLCFAVMRTALLDKRQCFLISFSTGIQTIELSDLYKNLPALIGFLTFSFHGGTDAIPAFKEALRQLKTKSYEKADILMISDFILPAVDEDTQNTLQDAKQKGTRLHSLIISSAANPQALNMFDNNWAYQEGSYESFKKALKNIRYLNSLKNKGPAEVPPQK